MRYKVLADFAYRLVNNQVDETIRVELRRDQHGAYSVTKNGRVIGSTTFNEQKAVTEFNTMLHEWEAIGFVMDARTQVEKIKPMDATGVQFENFEEYLKKVYWLTMDDYLNMHDTQQKVIDDTFKKATKETKEHGKGNQQGTKRSGEAGTDIHNDVRKRIGRRRTRNQRAADLRAISEGRKTY